MTSNDELKNLIDAINRSDYSDEPYEHFYMANIFSDAFYNVLIQSLPDDSEYSPLPHIQAMMHDPKDKGSLFPGRSRLKGSLDEFIVSTRGECFIDKPFIDKHKGPWEKLANILYSPQLKEVLFEKFEKTIQQRMGGGSYFNPKIPEAEPTVLLTRDKKGYRIYPHPDTVRRIVTFQIYLPEDNSHSHLGTVLNTPREKLKPSTRKSDYLIKEQSHKEQFKEYKRFEYHRNSGCSFAVCQNSWHSVNEMVENYNRNSIQIMYIAPKQKLGLWAKRGVRWGADNVWIPPASS